MKLRGAMSLHEVANEGQCQMRYEQALAKIVLADPDTWRVQRTYETPLDVEANHGVWLVKCPEVQCDSGITGERDWANGRCFACGCKVTFNWPDAFDTIELLLVRRRAKNQNWLPGESVADLQAENVILGVDDGV